MRQSKGAARLGRMEFDPEYWLRLARENPQEFERQRLEAIEAVIAEAPPAQRERLRALQCRIDLELRKARTALGGAIRLQQLMWERFEALRMALNALQNPSVSVAPAPSAEVIPFAPRQ